VLLQFLLGFGSLVGSGPNYSVGAGDATHHTNLYVVVVGESANSRKGTSWSDARKPLSDLDPHWRERCIDRGLSSGEGLIWRVRDPIEMQSKTKDGTSISDPGISDKRLLIEAFEFASVLRVMEREGNTLSGVLREAWDSNPLSSMTKNCPARATGAHISIVAHITKQELLKYLTSSESANGFGNRFLYCYADRSKFLPHGGKKIDWNPIQKELNAILPKARAAGDMQHDQGAYELWELVYEGLNTRPPGLLGAVTARAHVQVIRLSCIYALLDGSSLIRIEHLISALEVWRYCEDSARYIFGQTLGDGTADKILIGLQANPDGLSRWEITDRIFSKHIAASELDRALGQLRQHGLATSITESTNGKAGRPGERWFASNCRPTPKWRG